MTDLKTKIARGEYEIDSRKVAEEIIAKLRIVDRARRRLDESNDTRPGGRFVARLQADVRRAVIADQ